MADNKVRLNYVESCNLGKLGSGGVALKINFVMSAGKIEKGPYQSAAFGLSQELAQNLAIALTAALGKTTRPTQH